MTFKTPGGAGRETEPRAGARPVIPTTETTPPRLEAPAHCPHCHTPVERLGKHRHCLGEMLLEAAEEIMAAPGFEPLEAIWIGGRR